MKKKLLVLCGGQSSEHIVSRMSCTSVLNNLDKELFPYCMDYMGKMERFRDYLN